MPREIDLPKNESAPPTGSLIISAVSQTGIFTGRRGFVPYSRLVEMDRLATPVRIEDTLKQSSPETGQERDTAYFIRPSEVALAFVEDGNLDAASWWLGYAASFNGSNEIDPETIARLEELLVDIADLEKPLERHFWHGVENAEVEFEDRETAEFEGLLQLASTAGKKV